MVLQPLTISFKALTLGMLEELKPEGVTIEGFVDELTRNWFMWPFYQQPFWIAVRQAGSL